MLGTYENFRKYHGTSRIFQDDNWNEYKKLIFELYNKGFNIFELPTSTMKEKNYSVEERFILFLLNKKLQKPINAY